MFCRLLPVAPVTLIRLPFLRLAALLPETGSTSAPVRYLPGQRFWIGHDLFGRTLGNDLAAVNAGCRADIQQIIRRQNGVLVMLDDNHRIAEIAQMAQRIEQPGIVALMQADGRFIQHIQNAGQAGTDLRGEANALAFTARQACRNCATGSGNPGPHH